MSRTCLALAATLALLAVPGTALATQIPTGEYHGTSSHHGPISFTVNHARTEVTNFKISGHVFMTSSPLMTSSTSLGHFGAFINGVHLWGAWKTDFFPTAAGGYSYTERGVHHVVHWSARVPGT